MSFRAVLEVDDLWPGEMKGVIVGRVKVLIVNLDGRLFAYEDRCAHQGVALSDGKLEGGTLTCSAHQWRYDLSRGIGVNPTCAALRAFPVKVEAGHIQVDVDDAA